MRVLYFTTILQLYIHKGKYFADIKLELAGKND